MNDRIAERARETGGTTLRSIGQIGRLWRALDNDDCYVSPQDILREQLRLVANMRQTHSVCDEHDDGAMGSLLENWIEERSSRQGRSLAGCKSPYRQLPVVGRLAYPMRGEVTNRVLLGRKSPGCPAGVFAAVGTIWGASKLGGRNITKYLQPRKSPRMKSFQAG